MTFLEPRPVRSQSATALARLHNRQRSQRVGRAIWIAANAPNFPNVQVASFGTKR